MKNKIYYFSATGNSLAAAKTVSNAIGNTELINIATISGKVDIEAERLGFIFPVYAWGIPRIVVDFLSNTKSVNCKYVYAIATCGGANAYTLVQLQKILKKKNIVLNAGFAARMESANYGKKTFIIKLVRTLAGKLTYYFDEYKDEIIQSIQNYKDHKPDRNRFLANLISHQIYKLTHKIFPTLDKNFNVEDSCNGCAICQKICPRDNIKIKNKKPFWKSNCEQCAACLHWCPKESIQVGESKGKERYHHKDVVINDMVIR